jgi:hypothetical protein
LAGAGFAACGGFRSPAKVDTATNWLSKRMIAAAREQRMSRFRKGLAAEDSLRQQMVNATFGKFVIILG